MLHRLLSSAAFVAALSGSSVATAQDAERALLIVDPNQPESMYVANYYMAARDIPPQNVLYMTPGAASYGEFADVNLPGFFGALAHAGIEEQVDFVIVPPGPSFFVPAAGLINDPCSPVKRFAIPSAYTVARQSDAILGGLDVQEANHFSKTSYVARSFQGTTAYRFGDESKSALAERYFIGGMLGWTGQNGNTLAEILAMIDRSVGADGTHPVGTVYYMQTTDSARSSPRHDAYPNAVQKMTDAGGLAQHLFDNLPLGNFDCMGVMTGLANPAIDDPNFALLGGSFADHLTSYAATFDNNSQTKMSKWITKGASGTHGTVEEPCNYAGKFPVARSHVLYFKGVTLGEAWFRSVSFKPFQGLLLGDPLTRPYANYPDVDVPSPPQSPVSGTIQITPTASVTGGGNIAAIELFVDGVRLETVASGGSFTLDTTLLADGWHELRVRAFDTRPQRNYGRWVGELVVDNTGRDVALGTTTPTGDLGTPFDLSFNATGGALDEVVIWHNGRIVASSDLASTTVSVYGQNLGAGLVEVQAEALYQDGSRARSPRAALDIAYSGGGVAGVPPTSYSFSRVARVDKASLLELPATYDDDPSSVTYTVLTGPAQATLVGGSGAWRVLEPDVDADGSDTITYEVTNASGTSAAATIQIEYFDPDPCAPATNYCVATPNSVGSGAIMGHQGSLSFAANDLTLTASGCPPNQFGLFFYGQGQAQTSVSDGFLCIASNFVRYGAVQCDAQGMASQLVDYANPPQLSGQITAGSTWDFQFWYRDPSHGNFGNNFSDALEIVFCP